MASLKGSYAPKEFNSLSLKLEGEPSSAYNQPVTRAFIEQVRGVDCSAVVSTLIEKDLVEERGRLELPGRPLLYGTTKNFLRCFSLSSLEDLPPLPDKTPTINDYAEQLEVAEVVTDNQE